MPAAIFFLPPFVVTWAVLAAACPVSVSPFNPLPETLPPFTLRLSRRFVNGKQRISTGFLRVLAVFLEKRPKMGSLRLFLRKMAEIFSCVFDPLRCSISQRFPRREKLFGWLYWGIGTD